MRLFVPNRNIEADLEADPEWREARSKIAEAVRDEAESIAPRGPTGDYAESLKAEGDTIYTDDFAGHLVEFGSRNNPVYAVLRRAAQACGLRFVRR